MTDRLSEIESRSGDLDCDVYLLGRSEFHWLIDEVKRLRRIEAFMLSAWNVTPEELNALTERGEHHPMSNAPIPNMTRRVVAIVLAALLLASVAQPVSASPASASAITGAWASRPLDGVLDSPTMP